MYQGVQKTRRNFKRRHNEEILLSPDVKVKVEEADPDPTSAESVQGTQKRLQRIMKIRNMNKSSLNNEAGNKGRIKTEKCVKIKLETIQEEEEAVAVNTPKKIKLERREYLHEISSILFPGDVSSSSSAYSLYNFNLTCRFCQQNSHSILHSERNPQNAHKSDCACVNCDQMVASDPQLQHHLNNHLHPSCHHSQQQFETEQANKENNPPKTFHQVKNEHLDGFDESPGNSLSDSSVASSSSSDSMDTLEKLNESVNYDCKTCKRVFPNRLFLNIHEKTHASHKSNRCSFCAKRFYSNLNLQMHLLIHKKSFRCSQCPCRLIWNAGLKLHNKTCHTDRKVESISMRRNTPKTHKPKNKTTKIKRTFQCSFCEKKFNWKGDLNRHIRIHTGEKPFKCSVCTKDFNQKSTLNYHMRIHTGEKPFKCSVCTKDFNTKSYLNVHLKIHTGEKPFKCSVCTKDFNTKSYLNVHLKIHTGEKPFKCSVCKTEFNQKSTLKNHMRIHTGEKPFKCSVCKKDFNRNSHLNRHFRIHTGEKPFKCSVCKQDFNQKSILNVHFRIHTGEKPFKCSVCKKDFNTKSNLNRHFRTHTFEKSLQIMFRV